MSDAYQDRTPADQAAERAVAAELTKLTGHQITSFGPLCAVDFYSSQDGRLTGILELKCRDNPSTQYPTVFLAVRKWFALVHGAIGLQVPALYVVRFTDRLLVATIATVDGAKHTISGGRRKAGSHIEPLIEVPIATMRDPKCQSG